MSAIIIQAVSDAIGETFIPRSYQEKGMSLCDDEQALAEAVPAKLNTIVDLVGEHWDIDSKEIPLALVARALDLDEPRLRMTKHNMEDIMRALTDAQIMELGAIKLKQTPAMKLYFQLEAEYLRILGRMPDVSGLGWWMWKIANPKESVTVKDFTSLTEKEAEANQEG